MEHLSRIFAKAGLTVDNGATFNGLVNANTDTDRFLVADNGVLKFRTGAEILSDIGGASSASGLPIGGTAGQILAKIDATNYNTEWIDNFTTDVRQYVKAGEAINKGQAVYISSADGTNPIVSKASNASEATSSKTLGLLAQNLSHNGFGYVITEGRLSGLDTSSAQIADPVWLGTNGNLIFGLANKPIAPAHLVYLGVVTRVNANNGEIFVHVQNGVELNEIHDVLIQSVANKDIIYRDASTNLWKNASIATVLGFTPADNAALANYQLTSQKAQPNGYASLDGNGKVPLAQMNDSIIGQVEYMGLWNAATNTPTLSSTPQQKGHYYIVSAAGTQFGISFEIGDWIISNGTGWDKVDNTDAVNSVFGRVGNIAAAEADYQSFYPRLSQVYANPSWISELAWSKITGTPTTLAGYGITDAVPSSRTITINGTTYDLSANRTWTISEADTLATVTARGNTTSANVFLGQYLRTGSYPHFGETVGGLATLVGNNVLPGTGVNKIVRYAGGDNGTYIILRYNAGIIFGTALASTVGSEVDDTSAEAMRITTNRNVLINTSVDTGDYRLDANGFFRLGPSTGHNISIGPNYQFRSLVSNTIITQDSENISLYANNTGNIVLGTQAVPRFAVNNNGTITASSLSGTGTRMVVSDSSGVLSTQAIPVGTVTSVGLSTGTSGTDVNVSGSPVTGSGVITLNIPTASATNRGVLSSADWTSFNSKEPAIASGTTSQYWRGDKSWQTLNTTAVTEGTNLYYTDARARLALSVTAPISYDSGTGVISIAQSSGSTNGFLSSTDWTTFNNKVGGSGTINYLSKFTASGTIGNSQLFDNGTNVEIGYGSAQGLYKLDVNGSVRVNTNLYVVDAIGIGVAPNTNRPLQILKNLNTTVGIRFENTNTGANAFSALQMGEDINATGTKFVNFLYVNSSVSRYGAYVPQGTSLINVGSGGLNLGTVGGGISFYNALLSKAGEMFSSGNWYLGTGLTPTDAGFRLDVSGTFRTSGNSVLALSSGAVLVGTSTDNLSGAKLQVSGAVTATQYTATSTGGSGLRIYGASGTNQWDIYLNSTNLRFSDNTGTGTFVVDRPATFSSTITATRGIFGTTGSGTFGVHISDNDQSNVRLRFTNTGTGGQAFSLVGGNPGASNAGFAIYDETNAATRLYISSTGNLGLGVTPSAWGSGYTALQIGSDSSFMATTNGGDLNLQTNAYFDGSVWRYIRSSVQASSYFQTLGQHIWRNAPSGTAGNAITFTQRMTLDASGNLGLGVTPSAWGSSTALQIGSWTNLSSSNAYGVGLGFNTYYNGTNHIYTFANFASMLQQSGGEFRFYTAPSGSANAAITFTQAMTLTASGNLGIGITSPVARLHAENTSSADPSSLGVTPTTNVFGMSTSPGGMLAGGIGATGGTYVWLQGRNKGGAGVSYPISLNPLGGNVGIGVTAPAAPLQVAATGVGGYGTIGIRGTSAHVGFRTSADAFKGWVGYFDSATHGSDVNLNIVTGYNVSSNIVFKTNGDTGEAMRITSSGNVGIGTASPTTYSLSGTHTEIYGGSTYSFLHVNTASVKSFLAANESAALTALFTYSNHPLTFGTNNAERIRITSSGRTLIGTTTDNTGDLLQVAGSVIANGFSANAGNSLRFYRGANDYYWRINNDSNNYLNFGTFAANGTAYGTNPKMILLDNGNVGVGTATPSGILTVANLSSATLSNGLIFAAADLAGADNGHRIGLTYGSNTTIRSSIGLVFENLLSNFNSYINFSTGSSNTERMRITSGGDVLVNTTSVLNGSKFTIDSSTTWGLGLRASNNGGVFYFQQFFAGNTQVGTITSNGTSTTYSTSSDYRLKTDLKDFAGIDIVNLLKVYDYEWKSDKSRSYGVLAHELQSVIPYAVTGMKDGEMMQGVDYSKIVPVLVKAIQELKTELDTLKK